LTDTGPQVVEFNCRFGDPETQVLMPRMESELLPVMIACFAGDISGLEVSWGSDVTVGVVLAAEGYPGNYTTGHRIVGAESLRNEHLLLHAGTDIRVSKDGSDQLVTAGGRVLTVVGKSHDLATARKKAYQAVAGIEFSGKQYRQDIAKFSNK